MAKLKYADLINQMTLEEKASLMSGKDFWQTVDIKRLNIPSIFLADGPHGIRKQAAAADHLGLNESIKATCFPSAATMANSWNIELGLRLGKALSKEALTQKVNVLLGPGLNMKRNPRCGRNFEYFSEDPYLAGKFAANYIRGIQTTGISGCVKHYACNNQEERRMSMDSVLDERTLREIYLTGFEIAVKEGKPKTLMSSYNLVNGEYANENQHILNEILRKEWKYKGVVVSDWGGVNDRVEGLKASNELEMPSSNGDTPKEIVEAVKSGYLNENILNECVDRLLTLVFNTEEAFVKNEKGFDLEAHHLLAQECAEESLVLLKNENNALPLKQQEKVAIIGDFAKKARYQGAGSSVVNPTKLDNVLDIINEYDLDFVGYEPGFNRFGKKSKSLMNKALKLANKADTVLLFIGLDEVTEAEGLDRSNIHLPQNQITLINEIAKLNKKVIAVLACGAVIELNFDDKVDGLLHTYLTGQAGPRAILNILTGKVNPSGKLAETYPLSYDDVSTAKLFPGKFNTAEYREGLYIGYRYFDKRNLRVKYPFGYGLSYTKFEYSNLEVSEDGVSFVIKNTGAVKGKEIAQLYIGLKDSTIFRPLKELKGFVKVELLPGQSKKVQIKFDDYSFRYFNVKTNKFEVEPGTYDIYIGSSINNIRLTSTIVKEGTTDVKPYDKEKLPSYYSGDVQEVSLEEFEELLGYKAPKAEFEFIKKNRMIIHYNTTVAQLKYARGWAGRFFARVINFVMKLLKAFGNPTLANTIVMGVYHQPMRGLSRMTGGAIHWKQLDGLIMMFNGKFFKGLHKFFKEGRLINKEKRLKKKELKQQLKKEKQMKDLELKRQKQEEKAKVKAMSRKERKEYYASLKAEKYADADRRYAEWLKDYETKIIKGEKKAIFQGFIKSWNKFKFRHEVAAKWIYQIFYFFVFSNGVTIWQYLVMLFLPHAFGLELAAKEFVWPQVTYTLFGKELTWGIFNELVKYGPEGNVVIGGGLGNFIAFEIAVFTAQCINFPLQRNITFKSNGNVVWQAMWYFIGWVAISVLVNAVYGFVGPVFEAFITDTPAITNLVKTFITGGLSMVVFFFIFKIIFPENKDKKEETK